MPRGPIVVFCGTCRKQVEIVSEAPDPANDGIRVFASCHGESVELNLPGKQLMMGSFTQVKVFLPQYNTALGEYLEGC